MASRYISEIEQELLNNPCKLWSYIDGKKKTSRIPGRMSFNSQEYFCVQPTLLTLLPNILAKFMYLTVIAKLMEPVKRSVIHIVISLVILKIIPSMIARNQTVVSHT